ncbi:hypothetical protein DCS_02275 [Drechmeria coniospora]|uniref:Uncharacterized protein n=1 Tax=Drechmeria coniospora TaxID=98403 RepID=A0A151GVK7_DRECN|nr:hypothetical protein DCS_02275 [Drechmeria coniospora]KYK61134.1 hypothetical protein DCS_02275 [Drechmeria coniospora]
MGVCQSCLGRRDRDIYDENEDTRLLYEDGNGMQYGSFGDPALNGDDSVEAQRENEALQRVVAMTSKSVDPRLCANLTLIANGRSNMVDVFEIAHNDVSGYGGNFAYAGQGARVARYQHLVSKLSTDEFSDPSAVKVDWLAEDDMVESQSGRPLSIKTLEDDREGGPFVGTFADAAAAMQ